MFVKVPSLHGMIHSLESCVHENGNGKIIRKRLKIAANCRQKTRIKFLTQNL